MIKPFFVIIALLFSALSVEAAPPNPHTFVPNRGIRPSILMAGYMKSHITIGVRDAIYIWNRSYAAPSAQIADLMFVIKNLSETPKLPMQMLENQQFELAGVLNTSKMLNALERFRKDVDQVYLTLFEYSNLIVGSKKGDIDDAYKDLFSDMRRMVKSYNNLAEVTNGQYRKKVMPFYSLNYKKKRG